MSEQTAVTPDPSASTTTTQPDPSSSTTQPTTPSQTPAKPSFSYEEDRSTWIPQDKFRAAERATNLAAQRASQLEAELAAERRRVQALAGVTPQDPQQADQEKIRAAFHELFPWAKAFEQLSPEQLADVLESATSGRQAERVIWDRQRDATLNDLHQRAADAYGVEKLSASQAEKIDRLFKASVPDLRTDPDGHEKFRQRYEAGDKTLLDEFVKSFADDFITPAQRAQAAQIVARRRNVPSGGFSSPVISTEPKPKPGNLDAAMDRAAKILHERGAFNGA